MMKIAALILSLLLILASCTSSGPEKAAQPDPSSVAPVSGQKPAVSAPLTVEETVEQYFSLQYDAYINMRYDDMRHLVDTTQQRLLNELVWLETITLRRQLIAGNGLGYVETRRFPYTINYQEAAEDGRMEFWRSRGLETGDSVTVHFTLTGEPGKAYPPFMAMNNQHTMRLKQADGVWKIIFHYYSGASRFRNTTLTVPSREEMLSGLKEEFSKDSAAETAIVQVPAGAAAYDGKSAAAYGLKYTETANPVFYHAGDWQGNCANFTSQCIWSGFGGETQADIAARRYMTSQWQGGQGGGTPAWENVEYFWKYLVSAREASAQGLHGTVVKNINQLALGGLVQTGDAEDPYSHSLLLVDSGKLMLAQNSPASFVYYSDLVSEEIRFFNPTYLIR